VAALKYAVNKNGIVLQGTGLLHEEVLDTSSGCIPPKEYSGLRRMAWPKAKEPRG